MTTAKCVYAPAAAGQPPRDRRRWRRGICLLRGFLSVMCRVVVFFFFSKCVCLKIYQSTLIRSRLSCLLTHRARRHVFPSLVPPPRRDMVVTGREQLAHLCSLRAFVLYSERYFFCCSNSHFYCSHALLNCIELFQRVSMSHSLQAIRPSICVHNDMHKTIYAFYLVGNINTLNKQTKLPF